jgi:hypothetical protein
MTSRQSPPIANSAPPAREQRSLSDPSGDVAMTGASTATSAGTGCDREPGPQDRVVPHFGEEQDRREEHRGERRAERQRRGIAPREVADGEQLHVERRRGRRTLMDDEHAEYGQPADDGADRSWIRPAPRLALHQSERHEPSGERDQYHAGGGGEDRSVVLGLMQDAAPGEHGEQPDRQVDEEDPPPAGGLHQNGAERRPQRTRHRTAGTPDGDGEGNLGGRERAQQ